MKQRLLPSYRLCRIGCRAAGFTLVEMAIVVTIIAVLLTLGVGTAISVLQSTQRSATKERLNTIRLALAAYYRNERVFPCTDAPVGAAVRDGVQNFTGANCSAQFGTVPYTDLGLTRETVLDGYGNYISYRLANNWYRVGGTIGGPTLVCGSTADTYIRPPVPAPALTVNYSAGPAATVGIVLISHGSNGFGAWNQGNTTASRNLITGATAAEITNQTLGATYNDLQTPVAPNATFDDLVATLAPANIICN
jgi:prepilin-type N-terminal cleavage/methylation domain-containing protein